jgi:hypothetical protein
MALSAGSRGGVTVSEIAPTSTVSEVITSMSQWTLTPRPYA